MISSSSESLLFFKMKTVAKRVAVSTLTVLILSACDICEEDRTRIGISDLNANEEKWSGLDVRTYVLTYSTFGLSLPISFLRSNRVVVESGEIVQVDILDSDGDVIENVLEADFGQFFKVEDLFEEVRGLNSQVKGLEVQYSQETGIPSSVFVDPNLGVDGCGDVLDDEYSITANIEF